MPRLQSLYTKEVFALANVSPSVYIGCVIILVYNIYQAYNNFKNYNYTVKTNKYIKGRKLFSIKQIGEDSVFLIFLHNVLM